MIEDQPPPKPQPSKTPVWDLVIEDVRRMFTEDDNNKPPKGTVDVSIDAMLVEMRQRDTLGRVRYGTPLTTHNGRDHLVDAYQEALDLAVYLRTEIEERGANYVIAPMHAIYHDHLINLSRLRFVIWVRDNPPRFGSPSIVSG